MRTRFTPIPEARTPPDPRVTGVHLELGGLAITGMVPRREPWGRVWFQNLDGWWNRPGSTGESTQRLLAHGGWDNRAFFTPRIIEITGLIDAPSRPALREGIEDLMSRIPLDVREPLVVREDGLTRHVMARQSGDPDVAWEQGGRLLAEWNIQLSAADHRKLTGDGTGDSWRTHGPVSLPMRRGGIRFPLRFPWRSDAVTTSGRITLALAGTATPSIRVEFHGPVTRPGVREIGSGRRLWFDLTLTEGQTLSVDLITRSVLMNGVSRRGTRRGDWITPQARMALEFVTGTYSEAARMSVLTQEAWL